MRPPHFEYLVARLPSNKYVSCVILFDYQPKWHCSKTSKAGTHLYFRLITSRNGTAPKQGAPLDGATVVHNHTKAGGEGSFGKDDFLTMREHPEMARLIALDSEYDYEATNMRIPANMTYNDAMANPNPGLPDGDMKHSVMEYVDELGYVDYQRTRI